MSDWVQPGLTDPYSNFLDSLKARDYDAISLGIGTITNPQAGMMRYVRASNKFQEYDGTTWVDKVLSVAGGGTGSSTPAGAIGALGLGTMAVQNANAVNIVGGSISGLGGLGSNGPVSFGGTLSVSGAAGFGTSIIDYGTLQVNGITTLNGQVNMNNMNAAAITAASLGLSGNLTCARLDASLLVSGSHTYTRGQLLVGPSDKALTYPDGRIVTSMLGFGWAGGGTKVLLDNDQWVDFQTIAGGGVREVLHNDISFGSGEQTKDIILPWATGNPPSAAFVDFKLNGSATDISSINAAAVNYKWQVIAVNMVRVWREPGRDATNSYNPANWPYTAIQYKP